MGFVFRFLSFDLIGTFGVQVKVSAKGLWALDLGLCVIGFEILFRALDFELLESGRWILDFGLLV